MKKITLTLMSLMMTFGLMNVNAQSPISFGVKAEANTSNFFLTRQAVQTVGGFSPLRYLHDYDYIFRVLLAFPQQVRFLVEESLLFYRIHGSNTISEAAIIGREQDKAVIRKYLLARLPENLQALTAAGIDRLVELEQELMQEHRRREESALPGISMQAKNLLRSCAKRLLGRA